MSVERIVGPSQRALSGLSEKEALKVTVEELVVAVRTLISIFEKAKEEIKSEPTQQVLMKLDELIVYNKQLIEQNREIIQQTSKALQQNKEMSSSLLTLLDLHRQHLPEIAKNTRLTSEVRRVPAEGFTGPVFFRTKRPMPRSPGHHDDVLLHP